MRETKLRPGVIYSVKVFEDLPCVHTDSVFSPIITQISALSSPVGVPELKLTVGCHGFTDAKHKSEMFLLKLKSWREIARV